MACLDQIERLEPTVRAFITLLPSQLYCRPIRPTANW